MKPRIKRSVRCFPSCVPPTLFQKLERFSPKKDTAKKTVLRISGENLVSPFDVIATISWLMDFFPCGSSVAFLFDIKSQKTSFIVETKVNPVWKSAVYVYIFWWCVRMVFMPVKWFERFQLNNDTFCRTKAKTSSTCTFSTLVTNLWSPSLYTWSERKVGSQGKTTGQ